MLIIPAGFRSHHIWHVGQFLMQNVSQQMNQISQRGSLSVLVTYVHTRNFLTLKQKHQTSRLGVGVQISNT